MAKALVWTAEMDAQLLRLRADGWSLRLTGQALGVSAMAVWKRGEKLDVAAKSQLKVAA